MLQPVHAPTRRTVLGAAAVALLAPALAGCTQAGDVAPATPPVPADVVAADRAAGRERVLLATYDAALLIAPQLADRLLPLRADHAAHLLALGLPEQPEPAAAPSTAASAGPAATAPGASAAPSPPPVAAPPLPSEPEALLAALAELERRAAVGHANAAVRAGRGVGAVLASLAASEASHELVLA